MHVAGYRVASLAEVCVYLCRGFAFRLVLGICVYLRFGIVFTHVADLVSMMCVYISGLSVGYVLIAGTLIADAWSIFG